MKAERPDEKVYCRSLWISDVHLGSAHSKADELLALLDRVQCEKLYLVGDIIDLLAMQKRVNWPPSHNQVIRKIMKLSRRKTKVIYVPGNHDWAFRTLCNSELGAIDIRRKVVHTTANGKQMLVTHGDELDYAVRFTRLNRLLGDLAYDILMWLNRWNDRVRDRLKRSRWSLATWVKGNVGKAEQAINAYQEAGIRLALDRGLDGIICGHLHYPAIREYCGVMYCNDGDWVENCTALVEDFSGTFRLIRCTPSTGDTKEVFIADVTEACTI